MAGIEKMTGGKEHGSKIFKDPYHVDTTRGILEEYTTLASPH